MPFTGRGYRLIDQSNKATAGCFSEAHPESIPGVLLYVIV